MPPPCNPVGVQLLERSLHRQLFPPSDGSALPTDPVALDVCKEHLQKHGLEPSQASRPTPTAFQLPPLQGKDLGEHFWTIGRRAVQPWLDYAEHFSQLHMPPPPAESEEGLVGWTPESWLALDESLRADVPVRTPPFSRQPGWSKYAFVRGADGTVAGLADSVSVPYPDVNDSSLVFDVEVMVKESPYPVMAAAVGEHAWYTWISPWLAQDGENYASKQHLIPLGPRDGTAPPRLVICHNAGFDRASVLDEYTLQCTSIRWLDTMSLHVATSGISSPQRAAWAEHARTRATRRLRKLLVAQRMEDDTREQIRQLLHQGELDDETLAALTMRELGGLPGELRESLQENMLDTSVGETSPMMGHDEDHGQVLWQDVTSKNSLADVAALHCGIHMDKQQRDIFVDGSSRETVWAQLPSLLAYCANDVATTFSVFAKVWPAYMRNCPHPATLAGVLALGSTFLPVDKSWPAYLERASAQFQEMNAQVISTLRDMAHQLMQQGVEAINADAPTDRWWETDPWYSQLDWSPKKPRVWDGVRHVPAWWRDRVAGAKGLLSARTRITAQLLQLRCDGAPVRLGEDGRWYCEGTETPLSGSPLSQAILQRHTITSAAGKLGAQILALIAQGGDRHEINDQLHTLAAHVRDQGPGTESSWQQLDWTPVPYHDPSERMLWWPKWYWDLYDTAQRDVEITIRAKIAPLLLKIAWDGAPVFRSRQHGWVFRASVPVPNKASLVFEHEADAHLRTGTFYKLPHANGDACNVGHPFSKHFLPYFEFGRLKSLHPSPQVAEAAKAALDMNAQCSYWISARDRIERQFVVWDGSAGTQMGYQDAAPRGLILPQVISMGTVTRRAIERTWLTASNAKKNRIGSELKSMVRAPPGWAIVGADVDSEELWICSVMGDAQFGIHGATAIGWMTLEGSKSQGTDLHSKTAAILGTGRNQAKVFNYSRIYGAGIRHAMQLLLKANPSMSMDEAARRAKQLYAATKGQSTRGTGLFQRKFWFGGTESFVFNKLEEIALSDQPTTPALDCGITAALSKRYLPKGSGTEPQDFMPSRINWVVQSSGVDYLHLLITAMHHLCSTYDIDARFMLSVHDEVRYLARAQDQYRTALALQIANLWTRAMFAFKLNMDDLPESCAFFAAVDIDHVLRKEVDDPCVTPSQPTPIPPGESLDIHAILSRTRGSLFRDARPMPRHDELDDTAHVPGTTPQPDSQRPTYVPRTTIHRCTGETGLLFLQAQASSELDEIRTLDRRRRRLQRAASQPVRTHRTWAAPPPAVSGTCSPAMDTLVALASLIPVRPRPPSRCRRPERSVPCAASAQRTRPTRPAKDTSSSRPSFPSGALLPPSLYNKPMLRYKPTQPIHMTMMIQWRRRARLQRLQRWDEIQEIKRLAVAEAFKRSLRASASALV
ncbi:DNA-directed DNA polymerase [Malassezia nana]|uniref:DNA-directed DNA polymerase n=1 Tax=Malassezia nana TaxID=180528 RepID=A0AAF0EL18_9BASI|nr:DNA-directed DNA polymerase [Malassezia nana]